MANKDSFQASLIHVFPILVSLLFGILCAVLVQESSVELEAVLDLPEAGIGFLFIGAVFVFIAGVSATLIYLLMKYSLQFLVRLLIGVSFSVLTFSLVFLYSELLLEVVGVEFPFMILFLASSATVYVILEVILRKGRLYEIVILAFGGATGVLLGASIPLLSGVTILLLLAVYDVFAVFRGPVGKIALKSLDKVPGISFSFRGVHVGLGDLTFYSMLVSRIFLSYGWLALVAATFGVLLGSFLSFKMVEKKGMFPGLPFSVLLGLLGAFLV
ncbi:hypothetical protein KAX01_03725, partial [Candidatus Bathyarchaeota archaeon]|nr:hypothetical protein [Candidatus Bathyarchaeota archaeon]